MKVKEPTALKKRRRNKGDVVFYSALMILPVIQILIFYFGVNFQTITMAFQRYDVYTDSFIWDLKTNITQFLTDIQSIGFWAMIKNSLFA